MPIFLLNQSIDIDGTVNADEFVALEDLTLGRTLDGLGGTDLLYVVDADGDPTTNPEIEISDVVDIVSIEEIATYDGGARLSIGQLASFQRIVDNGGNNLFQTYNLSAGVGGSSATLRVVGVDELTVNGSGNAETLNLGSSTDNTTMTLNGNGGNDVLTSGDGDDVLNGGANDDTLDGLSGTDDLTGGDGNDTLIARDGDTLDGDLGNVFAGADRLSVAATLNTGTLDGGGGALDTLDVEASAASVTIAAAVNVVDLEILALDSATALAMAVSDLDGFATITRDGSTASSATLTLSGAGTATTDVTLLSSLTVVDQLTGAADDDTLTFTGAVDITYDGGNDQDDITTGGGDDTLFGGADADRLDGGAGADTLNGEGGIDTLILRDFDTADGGTENDVFVLREDLLNVVNLPAVIDGGDGTDIMRASGARTVNSAVEFASIEQLRLDGDLLTLSIEQFEQFDLIFEDGAATTGRIAVEGSGTAATTNVTGLSDLVVTASTGSDVLTFNSTGFAATDMEINAGDLDDTITSSVGADTLRGQDGRDTLNAADGADTLLGGEGADTLVGGGGTDTLKGGKRADTLLGGTQADDLEGGGGDDTLTGEGGADTFIFRPGGGRDAITDFADGSDQIEIGGFGADFDQFEEIQAVAFQSGDDVDIRIPNPVSGTTIILIEDLDASQLDPLDFVFV